MDCPAENTAFTDRTGTAAAQASEAAAVQFADAALTRATDIAPLEAVPILDPELFPADDELVIDDLVTGGTAPAPEDGVPELEDASDDDDEDEGPLEELIAFEVANAEADGMEDVGIPQEILDAIVNPAAATGEAATDDAAPAGEPVTTTALPTETTNDDAAKEKTDQPVDDGADTPTDNKDAATKDDGASTDADPLADLSPADKAIALGEAQDAAAAGGGTDADMSADMDGGADNAADDTTDMGDGTAMTPDMCPMEAAAMMAGETTTGMADMANDMMSEMADMDMADMEMADMSTDDMG